MLSESQHLEPPVFLPTLPAKTPFTSSWVWEVSEKIGSGSFGDIYMGIEPINSDALVVGMVPVVWQGLMFARLLLLIGIRTDIRTLSEQSVIVVIVSNIKSHLDILISTYHDCSLLSSFICMFIGNHRNRIHCCLPGYELCIFTVPRYQHFYRRACGHQVGICQSPAPFVTRIHGIVICRHKCQSCSGSGPLVLLAWHDYWKLLIYVTSTVSFRLHPEVGLRVQVVQTYLEWCGLDVNQDGSVSKISVWFLRKLEWNHQLEHFMRTEIRQKIPPA